MGRRPNSTKVLETTGRTLWDILLKDCKDCKCVADATQLLSKLGVTLSDGGLYKNIKDGVKSKDIPKDSPCVNWPLKITNKKTARQGRQSHTAIVLAKTGRSLWDILKKEGKDCSSIFEAVEVLDKMDLSISASGLLALIKRTVDSGELTGDEFFAQWNMSKSGSGKKGKKSFTDSVEEHFHMNLVDLLRDKCSQCSSPEEALMEIKSLTKSKVSTSENTFLRSLDNERDNIKESDFFYSWLPKHREKKEEGEEVKPSLKPEEAFGNNVPMNIRCSNCGMEKKEVFIDYGDHNFGIKARRCPKCDKWGTYVLTGTVLYTQIRVGIVDGVEKYLDKDNRIVHNPFTSEECVNRHSRHIDRMMR